MSVYWAFPVGSVGVHAYRPICSTGPRKDASWQLPALRRPVVRRAHYAPRRISFGRITEHLEVPNLLAIQTESFDWLVGNEAWQARSADDPHARSGLAEILEEISPIEDFSGTMSLSFSAPRFDEVKASIEECKEKDLTYCAPLFVTAEFTNHTTGEIKSQTVFMGDFPMMTPKGTFIINGTERVVVSQLVRSPGVYFSKEPDKTSDRDLSSVKVIPSRGAWLEFDIDKRDTVGVRIDRKRRQAVTVLLKAIGWIDEQIRERFGWSELMMTTLEKDHIAGAGRGAARHLPQAAPGRAADPGERADPARQPLLQPEAVRRRQGRPVQVQQEARGRRPDHHGHADRGRHRRHRRVPLPAARR